ncbi:MAG: DoxX family protein [Frankiales bacterium]|nr:DoxX family protein [Frankiales bacterium]
MNDVDTAALLLRLVLGPMLLAHGLNKVLGSGGLSGTAGWFESLGLRPGPLHARAAATNEIVAGTLLTVGLLTPLAVAAYVGLMLVAAFTDHRGKGFFVFKGGWEYVAVVGGAAVVLALLGPGSASLDSALDIERSGLGWALGALGLGVAGGAAFLALFLGPWSRRPAAARD